MGKRKVAALEKVDADLANLQNKVRRDPRSYKEDFENNYKQYKIQREIFVSAPSSTNEAEIVSLKDLIDFIAHTAECFPELTKDFPQELIDLLQAHHAELVPDLREKLVTSLVLLRRKSVIESPRLVSALFPVLTTTGSKTLRTLLLQKILSDLRNSNSKTINHRLNRTVQAELDELVRADKSSSKALWAVKIVRELWKRQIWTESKPVEIMRECCLSDNPKVIASAVRFFLGGDKEREELQEDSSDDEGPNIGRLQHQVGINKKTKKKARAMENAISLAKKKEKKKNKPDPLNFSAFHLLHNPQKFAEDLFYKHLQSAKSRLNLEQKLDVLQLVTRLVGLHELIILPLYSYFLKYLTPRQQSVTSFLASLAQATHRLVPPDNLEPLVLKIANEFVSEAAAGEVAASGLNAIREICRRQPEAMNDTLLQDLVMYRKSKDKGVMMAARGLLSLYREVDASLLKRRDRGKEGAIAVRTGDMEKPRFGEVRPGEILGLEQLAQMGEDQIMDEEDSRAWDVEEDSDGSGGWIAVSSDEDLGGGGVAESDDELPRSRSKPKKGSALEAREHDLLHGDSAALEEINAEVGEYDEDEEDEGEEDDQDDEGEDEDDEDDEEEEDGDAIDAPLIDLEASSSPILKQKRPRSPSINAAKEKRPKVSTAVAFETDKENTPASTIGTSASKTWLDIATTRILTPADHQQLRNLALKQTATSSLSSHQKHHGLKPTPSAIQARAATRHLDEALTREDIEAAAAIGKKLSREEKVALAKEGKGERSEHKSTKAIRQANKNAAGKSSTNREKARKKNALMVLGKAKAKNKRSLVEKRRVLKAHVDRGKRGGKRGNKGC